MIIKQVEIRDVGTLIPAIAIRFSGEDGWLFRKSGFQGDTPYVYLVTLATSYANYDPFAWGNRTMNTVHLQLLNHWDDVPDDSVIDVEFLLGESSVSKVSDRAPKPTELSGSF
jgi:hypothetical protein